MIAVREVEMRGVAWKCHSAVPPAAPPTGTGSGTAWLDSTVQRPGAVTWKVNAAFRPGCSKLANTSRAWAGPKHVQKYTFPSVASTARCILAPVLV
jgi:hypothetical protein